jgi:dolichyl-phosphate-mannose--protein O-mannosyl transferase
MTEGSHPIVDLTVDEADAFLRRALRDTLILGLIAAVVVLISSGWRNAAMLVTGGAISAASILEWQRLVRIINAKMDNQKNPKSTVLVLVFFVLRLTVFAGVIYGSLKCFHGSVVALLCGLGLAALAVMWEAVRMLAV